MQAQLSRTGLSAENRTDLHFALGRGYGDRQLYAKSFENYSKGNALRRLGMDADPERMTRHRANVETLFTDKFFEERGGWGYESDAPILIVGLPRSGSTLLEQILSSHSQ